MEVISRKWAVAGATQSCVAAGCSCFAAVSSSAPELLVGFCGPRKKVIPSLLLSIYPSIYLSFFFFFFFFPSSSSSLSRYPKRCACLCLRAVRPMPKLLARYPPLHKKKCFFFLFFFFRRGRGENKTKRERKRNEVCLYSKREANSPAVTLDHALCRRRTDSSTLQGEKQVKRPHHAAADTPLCCCLGCSAFFFLFYSSFGALLFFSLSFPPPFFFIRDNSKKPNKCGKWRSFKFLH